MTPTFRSSRAPECVLPRAHRDASQRLQNYGPVQSMPAEKAGWSDWALRGYCAGIFIIGALYTFHAASDVTPPTSQHSTSAPIEARAGGKVSR